MKTALLRAPAAHDARTSDDAPDSRRSLCGVDCGGSPCSREADHRDRCDPAGTAPTLRASISAALAAPGALTATARAIAPAWGVSPESAQNTLCAWLKGRRKGIPLHAVEAILVHLDLVIVPAPAGEMGRGSYLAADLRRTGRPRLPREGSRKKSTSARTILTR